jgi:hypothetical protein
MSIKKNSAVEKTTMKNILVYKKETTIRMYLLQNATLTDLQGC